MPALNETARNIKIPRMVKIRQHFPDKKIANPYEYTADLLNQCGMEQIIKPGSSVCVPVGSRGIDNLKFVVRALIDHLKKIGAEPFIIPAMGSHGGGVAENQRQIVEGHGVTEDFVGAPIIAGMETVILGHTKTGVPIHMDVHAAAADFVIPVARIKAHTDFYGPIESGLCKMLTIGTGKHEGCARLHKEGLDQFATLIPEGAAVTMREKRVPFGIALVENAHDHLNTIKILRGGEIHSEEPKLLAYSKSLMPRLCFEHLDVLVVDAIGKDISGDGMDPNITGRSSDYPRQGFAGPSITRIVINDITERSHGCAAGGGLADFITKQFYNKFDPESTYANSIASICPNIGKIPIVMDTLDDAIRAAIVTCIRINYDDVKIVRIKDTLHLVDIECSESLIPECRENPQIEILDEAYKY